MLKVGWRWGRRLKKKVSVKQNGGEVLTKHTGEVKKKTVSVNKNSGEVLTTKTVGGIPKNSGEVLEKNKECRRRQPKYGAAVNLSTRPAGIPRYLFLY